MKNTFRKMIAFMMAATVAVLSFAMPAFAGAPASANITAEEWEVLRLVNHERFLDGLEPLTAFKTLQGAADIRAEELTRLTEHERPNGEECFTVLGEVGLKFSRAGENIAAGYRTPMDVVSAWMNSPGHRANILTPEFMHIGIGFETRSNDMYGTYWVQLFYTGMKCKYTSIKFIMPNRSAFPKGTGIDDMGIIGVLHCDECGDCCLPISSDFCSGFNAYAAGTQTVTVSCCGVTGSFEVEIADMIIGDVDGDGSTTVADALLAMRQAMELITLSGAQLAAGDIDGDGIVTVGDAIVILRMALQLY